MQNLKIKGTEDVREFSYNKPVKVVITYSSDVNMV
jgi:hypothetical protein